jgi:hypothetical protein
VHDRLTFAACFTFRAQGLQNLLCRLEKQADLEGAMSFAFMRHALIAASLLTITQLGCEARKQARGSAGGLAREANNATWRRGDHFALALLELQLLLALTRHAASLKFATLTRADESLQTIIVRSGRILVEIKGLTKLSTKPAHGHRNVAAGA